MAVVSIVTGKFNLSGSERGKMPLCHTWPNPESLADWKNV